jgi:hypothetical protein
MPAGQRDQASREREDPFRVDVSLIRDAAL